MRKPAEMQELPAGSPGLEEAASRLKEGKTNHEAPGLAEAIVMLKGYPSLLIHDEDYEEPEISSGKNGCPLLVRRSATSLPIPDVSIWCASPSHGRAARWSA